MTNAEIQVGEYVRTKDGYIGKLVEQCDKCFDFDNIIEYRGGQYLNFCYLDTIETSKHSFNIIDLIEVGDYVNGERVVEVGETRLGHYKYIVDSLDRQIFEENISTIVTKEQFQSMEYKVGGEDD